LPSNPIVLGFDTSAAHCAAALLSGDKVWAERHIDLARGQAEALFPLIEKMMADEGVVWSDIGLIAVGVGPGNFTGTRISVSAARGLALALGIPSIGVTTFEAMRGAKSLADKRPVLVSLPAPRGSVYLQEFEHGEATGKPQQVSLWSDPIALTTDIKEVIGHEAREVAHYLHQFGQTKTELPGFQAVSTRIGATIAAIAQDKWQGGAVISDRPAPVYVRHADAAPPRDAAPVILP
jgi:tRNA threonylcarbamoyladenosine biosynthesis protein TsaB